MVLFIVVNESSTVKIHINATDFAAKWHLVLAVIIAIKIVVTVMTPPAGDLINWAYGTSVSLGYITSGRFPPISETGVYGPIFLLLTPFFWFWTRLPIDHPPITSMLFSNSTPAISLSILLKLPLFVADVATGIIVFKITKRISNSETKSKLATLVWFGNPYNIYWIDTFGAMDAIPTLILMLAVLLGTDNKWCRSSLCLSAATILRIFPIFTLPFFLPAVQTRIRGYVSFMAGYVCPLIIGLIIVYATGAGTLSAIAQIPKVEYWVLDFLGGTLVNQYVRIALVLVSVQFIVTVRYWNTFSLLDSITVSLLALLIGAQNTPPHHFLWLSPLLTICVVLDTGQWWIFILMFLTASLHLTAIFGIPIPAFYFLDPFIGGSFYAAKAAYLVRVNLRNILTNENMQLFHMFGT